VNARNAVPTVKITPETSFPGFPLEMIPAHHTLAADESSQYQVPIANCFVSDRQIWTEMCKRTYDYEYQEMQ